jgi:hypothetical protein
MMDRLEMFSKSAFAEKERKEFFDSIKIKKEPVMVIDLNTLKLRPSKYK